MFLYRPQVWPIGQKTALVGRISSEVVCQNGQQIFFLDEIRIITKFWPQLDYGDKIRVIGNLEERLIKEKRVGFDLYPEKIDILDHGENAPVWTRLRKSLLRFRGYLEDATGQLLPEPQSSLLSGILLGSQREMPRKFRQSLQKTGTLHLIAASGQNISVVSLFLLTAFLFVFPRPWAIGLSFFGMIGYCLLTGASPAVIRAGVMSGLAGFVQIIGRPRQAKRIYWLSAWVMLWFDPSLLSSLSFQLSMAATGGILYFLSFFERRTFFKSNFFGKEMALTLAAQTGIMGVVMYHFQTVSLLSPLVNGLVGPLVPYIMNLGVLALLPGLFWPSLGRWLALPVWVALTSMVKIISFFGQIAWAEVDGFVFSLWAMGGYYLVLVAILIWLEKRELA
ncbi:ComEC/Rec2 family competence protein [Patescibacteria group bacterium]